MNHWDPILERVEKPARYIGDEIGSVTKDEESVKTHFAFCFPDVYEIGMSHLGLHILYQQLNTMEHVWCERVFMPWKDMEEEMEKENLPLSSIESRRPLGDFDIIGFTLQYEMSYTAVLKMLQMAGVPVYAKDRTKGEPLVIGGGVCTVNPEPIAPFFDVLFIGEAEEQLPKIVKDYEHAKEAGKSKEEFFEQIADYPGVYIPSWYEEEYNEDGTVKARKKLHPKAKEIIQKALIEDLDNAYYPEQIMIPFLEVVHDRVVLEMFRGCTKGCRFCQAGMVTRPIRERSPERLHEIAKMLIDRTGYEDISLSSLSSCDYSQLNVLVDDLLDTYDEAGVTVSLPSLRLDSESLDILSKIEKRRKGGLTFAPEAGTQRLRDVINKGINEEDLERAIHFAFQNGYSTIKLYFMIGLPTETGEDIDGIADIAHKVKRMFFDRPKEELQGNLKVHVSTACFVPKPFTPFQWEAQASKETFLTQIDRAKRQMRDHKITYRYHTPEVSELEAVLARGDRKLAPALVSIMEKGSYLDSWEDRLNIDVYLESFTEHGIDIDFYAHRERPKEEIFPWDFIDIGVNKSYLWKEREKAYKGQVTRDCRDGCTLCGVGDLGIEGMSPCKRG